MAIKVATCQRYTVNEIISELNQPDIKIVLYFFSPEFETDEIQKSFTKAFPEAKCIGASMIGGWSAQGALETGITAMSLSSDEVADVYVSFQEGVKTNPVKAARAAISELKDKTAGENINPDEYLGLIFFDGLCLGELIIKEFSLEQELNMAFVGGAAADRLEFKKTLICSGENISGDALAAVILKMKIPFFFSHYVHYIPTETSFIITRVETIRRIAWEIDGEPAAIFYAKQIGVDDITKLNAEMFAKHPLGLKIGNSVYVRSPNAVIDGAGLQFYCSIEAGARVHLLNQGDIISHAEKSLEAAEQFLPSIQGCLLFNCVLRYLELKELDKLDAFNSVFSKYPMIGFNTYGEELFIHHNQTLTAVFFGKPLDEGVADPYKTKRLFHYTNSKFKSLVFDIINRSELLNITISYLKGSVDAASGKTGIENYEFIMKSMEAMINQSNVSKEDIEKMLVVYQNNVEKTGEYVFSIVDEIRLQNRRLYELKEAAETANLSKSNFLASMSHEIRTPMNAITGMAELMLRGGLSEEMRGYAGDIKQAATNLIAIINDLLDFSKIEAGKLDIITGKYLLASLVSDAISIIRMRLMDKPVCMFTNIEANTPSGLIGDEVRLRQILLNILSNAVKYTKQGHIGLSIKEEKREKGRVWLNISVEDTGYGIKPEDQAKLFGEFIQLDIKKHRGIEGTGLGLAITKRLCNAMGGDISFRSEYGKGSTFSVIIPQGIHDEKPFASVDKPERKKVLIYERRSVYLQSISWSLENMKVPYTVTENFNAFVKTLFEEEWFYVFTGYDRYDTIEPVMNRPETHFPGGKKPLIGLLVEWGKELYIQNVRFLSVPTQSLSIANILNGKTDKSDFFETPADTGTVRYNFSNARVLVVDDILTNLKVAEGLITPYHIKVDSCLSGKESIDLVKVNDYDIIFMDHMMPEMDGVQTAAAIRALEDDRFKTVPIIALTANAVSGVREMFIENGFNDFLAKPIDITKLDNILTRWIRKEKRAQEGVSEGAKKSGADPVSVSVIQGADVKQGASVYLPLFNELAAALKLQKTADIDHALDELNKKPLDSKIKEQLERISDYILMTEFESAEEIIGDIINNKGE
ncbi:MAG: response regulator [Deferribacteraceae bacterium]|jgi:signal transduction histidine kinase/CheY-like chemotaxis protein|nr:response regulator [Deferribacteraceae bacterium]